MTYVQSQNQSQKMLAERTIKAAKATDKDQFLLDGNGLYVRITTSGRKTFVYKDQRGGKTKWVTLGRYPDMTPAEARQAAQNLREGSSDTSMTVRQLCDAYYHHVEKHQKSPRDTMFKLEPNIAKPLGNLRVARLTRAVLTKRFSDIVDRGSPVMANRVMAYTKTMLNFAVERGWIKDNPIATVTRKTTGGHEASRSVTLSFDEIGEFFKLIDTLTPRVGWTLYFCLLTGCRVSEAVWCLEHKTLHLPEAQAKTRAHTFPPTPHIRAVLKLAPKPPKWRQAMTTALHIRQLHYTPHDLRRTFATRLADMGVALHIIEKLLNHQMEGMLAIYNRAEYWPERITAQKLWEKKLREIRKRVAGEQKLDPA